MEKHEFRDTLERTMRMVQLEVMLCIAGDFNEHVGVAEPGEEECVGKFGWGTRKKERVKSWLRFKPRLESFKASVRIMPANHLG